MAALGHPQAMALGHLQARQLPGVAVYICHAAACELVNSQRTFSRNRDDLGLRAAQPRGSRASCRPPAAGSSAASAADLQADVCIIGAGIIGLCTALALLRADPEIRVVLVDRQVPCSGATGAGQGYLWLAHRAAGSPLWDLAARSMALWRQVLLQGGQPELTPAAVEWQGCGSLLLASSAEESWGLQARQAALQAAGLEARWLPARELAQLEPALRLAAEGSALLVPSDAQVNGRQTAAALQRACESFGRRFTALFHEPAQALLTGTSGRVEGVATGARRVAAPRGVVVAAGAWSAGFLAEAVGQPAWRGAFLPRKGLLLEMPRPRGMPQLHYAMMEAGYTKHYAPTPAAALAGGSSRSESSGTESSGSESNSSSSSGSKASTQTSSSETLSSLPPAAAAAAADITFTATTSAAGTLLVGSSREFSGWDTEADAAVVAAIMQRAAAFLPGLEGVPRGDISVRVGLRPYAVTGAPAVGPVPGAEGVLVAAGHEGSGLTLGPATAELLCDYILGRPPAAGQAVAQALVAHACLGASPLPLP